MTADVAGSGANLVLLPEAVLTGLINNDDSAHDLPLGQSIPSLATERLGAVARFYGLWVGSGPFWRHDDCLHDSVVLMHQPCPSCIAERCTQRS